MRGEVSRRGHTLYKDNDLGVGMFFLPHDNAYAQARAKAITEEVLAARGLFLFGWREVPINIHVLGEKAQTTMPRIEQVLIGRPEGLSDDEYERRLFLARNEIEKRAADDKIRHFYIPSFSSRVIVYKGLLVSPSLEKFYKDLSNPDYETRALRLPPALLARTPSRRGRSASRSACSRTTARSTRAAATRTGCAPARPSLQADFWGEDIDLLKPIIQPGGIGFREPGQRARSAGDERPQPAARDDHAGAAGVAEGHDEQPPELQAFYEYHRCFNEPWDGPAALVFTDGLTVGACLDRNGLRPARYKLTDGRHLHARLRSRHGRNSTTRTSSKKAASRRAR